jgi:hypothetical protein
MNKSHIIRTLLIYSAFCCLWVTAFGQSDSLATGEVKQDIPTRKTYIPMPVAPFYDTLFYINAGIGSFSSQDRAAAITERIRSVSKDRDGFHFDSLFIFTEGSSVEITYRDIVIMAITETDASIVEKTQMTLALEYEKIIQGGIM